MPVQPGRAVAPGSPVFELHTLGWRAFQDLCAAVLHQVWGQSVQAYSRSGASTLVQVHSSSRSPAA
jgi:hypothetical protein